MLEKVSFRAYVTGGYERLQSSMERHLTTLLCTRYSTKVCIHTSGTCGYVFLYVPLRYEAWGPPESYVIIEVYVIVNYVIASQFSMELMLCQRGLSLIVRNSEGYIISRVVISRFDLYCHCHHFL